MVRVATSWPFLLSLSLLLLNDLHFKTALSNWVTGKLSDFSGIFLVSLLLFCAFPRAASVVAGGISGAFAFWKSPASGPLIDLINGLGVLRFGRVVDYSDLAALLVMPVAYGVARRIDSYQIGGRIGRKMLAAPILVVSFLAVLGTSVIPYTDRYSIRRPDGYEPFDAALAASIIADVAKKHHLQCVSCERLAEVGEYRGPSMTMSYQINERRIIYFTIEDYPGLVFDRSAARMEKLRRDLQVELGTRVPNMEFVLPLPERRR